MFEYFVITVYFALLALPVVGIIIGLKYFPPEGLFSQEDESPAKSEPPQEQTGS